MKGTAPERPGVIRFGAFDFDLRAGELHTGDRRISLHDHSLEILRLLLEHPGQLVTREQLQARLWPNGTPAEVEHGANSAVNLIRDALGDDAQHPRFVETLPGVGYRFVASVEVAGEASGSDSPTETPLPEDTGHYTLLERIGAGGMGEVYRARDLHLDREVAIKFLPDWMANNPLALHRFRREAHTAASLNHSNVLAVYDLAIIGGAPCLVSELLVGRTLREVLDGGAVPVPEAIGYAQQIVSGLAAAHERGIVHRDLKPGNLFLTRDGCVKILDFGLAKQVAPPADAGLETTTAATTRRGAVLGTPGYESPEQVRGEEVDARSDLFAFGAVFHELLTGRQAFRRKTEADTVAAVLDVDPPAPSSLNPAVPASCDMIVVKALEKDRELRYQSATEIRSDLRRLERKRQSPTPAPPPTRRRVLTLLVAVPSVAAAVIVAVFLTFGGGRDVFKGVAAHQLTNAAGWEGDPSVSPDGTLVAYSAEEETNRHIFVSDSRSGAAVPLTHGDADDRFPCWTPDQTSVFFSSDRAGGGIFSVSRLGGEAPRLVVADAREPAVSPDGSKIAFSRFLPGSGGTRIFVASLADPAHAQPVTSDQDGLWDHHRPAWSDGGRSILYRAHMAIWRVNLDRKGATRLTPESQQCDRPVAAPDGSIYYGSKLAGSYALWRLPPKGGRAERVTLSAGELDPSLSADGSVLAYSTGTQDYNLVLHDLRSGAEERFGGVRKEYLPAFSPNSREVFFVADLDATGDQIWGVGTESGRFSGTPRRITEPPGQVSRPDCSHDGRWLVYYRVIGDQRDVWVVPTTGGPPIQITNDPAPDTTPAWSPDGTRIAFSSDRGGASRIWVIPFSDGGPGGPPTPLTPGPTSDVAPVWSLDGRRIAYIGNPTNGASAVWLVSSDGKDLPRQVTRAAGAERVHFDPGTGNLLVSAWWTQTRLSLRRVDPETGASEPLAPPVMFGRNPALIDFDVSSDGRFVVFSRDDSRGDIWVLDARPRGR
jgi:Tol biopolymer transport system component/serine/threonine protein kinase